MVSGMQSLDWLKTNLPYCYALIVNPQFNAMFTIAAFGLLLAGCVGIWLGKHRTAKQTEPPPTSVRSEAKGPGSHNITNFGGTVNYSGAATPTTAKSPQLGALRPAGQIEIEILPHTAGVDCNEERMVFFVQADEASTHRAILVGVRNKSGEIAKGVVAKLEFVSGDGTPHVLVLHGCWLDNSFAATWIHPGHTSRLLIAIWSDKTATYHTFECVTESGPQQPLAKELQGDTQVVIITIHLKGEDWIFKCLLDRKCRIYNEEFTLLATSVNRCGHAEQRR
jgi:hypothetical protein